MAGLDAFHLGRWREGGGGEIEAGKICFASVVLCASQRGGPRWRAEQLASVFSFFVVVVRPPSPGIRLSSKPLRNDLVVLVVVARSGPAPLVLLVVP